VVHKVTTRFKRAKSGTGVRILANLEGLIENIDLGFVGPCIFTHSNESTN
jgi:hypothetical protein